jgi:predicted amidohydrolase YtcJ
MKVGGVVDCRNQVGYRIEVGIIGERVCPVGGTAWLETPDCHGESTCSYWRDPQGYSRAVRFFAQAGVQTATHAIGDAAVKHVLDTLEAEGAPPPGLVHRVEHIETLPVDQISRFAQLGVIASMQPSHATDFTRADHRDNWSVRLGEERANRAWPCRDLLDAGATLVLGSDWPIAPYDPRTVLAAAQLRRPQGGIPTPPGRPHRRRLPRRSHGICDRSSHHAGRRPRQHRHPTYRRGRASTPAWQLTRAVEGRRA